MCEFLSNSVTISRLFFKNRWAVFGQSVPMVLVDRLWSWYYWLKITLVWWGPYQVLSPYFLPPYIGMYFHPKRRPFPEVSSPDLFDPYLSPTGNSRTKQRCLSTSGDCNADETDWSRSIWIELIAKGIIDRSKPINRRQYARQLYRAVNRIAGSTHVNREQL